MRCVASARTEKRRQSVQGAASWPRCLCSDREKTIRTHLDPLTFDDLSRGQSPPTRRRQAVLLSVASGKSEKELLCGSRMFCAGCFLREVRKEPPALCPKRGVALSCCASMAGRNLCAPACVVVLVRRGLQEFGRVRAPTDNFHSGRASSKSNALAAADRSCSGRESLWAGRRAFHGKRTGDGEKRVFRHSVKSGKHPSLSVTRRFCANASVHAPIGAFRPICPPLLPSSAA